MENRFENIQRYPYGDPRSQAQLFIGKVHYQLEKNPVILSGVASEDVYIGNMVESLGGTTASQTPRGRRSQIHTNRWANLTETGTGVRGVVINEPRQNFNQPPSQYSLNRFDYDPANSLIQAGERVSVLVDGFIWVRGFVNPDDLTTVIDVDTVPTFSVTPGSFEQGSLINSTFTAGVSRTLPGTVRILDSVVAGEYPTDPTQPFAFLIGLNKV